MRMIAKFTKGEELKFCSHLDLQRILMRAIIRGNVPVKYSEGFNKHPKLSMAMALSVGVCSQSEYFEIELIEDIDPDDFINRFNNGLPRAIRVTKARYMTGKHTALMACMFAAKYTFEFEKNYNPIDKTKNIVCSENIFIDKKTKTKIEKTDIRPLILKVSVKDNCVEAIIRCGNVNLKPFDFAALYDAKCKITRTAMYDENLKELI